jgi:hypothetical protein
LSDDKQPEKTDEFIARARKRLAAAAEDEKDLRKKFAHDLKFASPDGDEQWDAVIKEQRRAAKRPAMSFPRCHTFVQQVSNEARQKKPTIKFAPRLDQDKDTAEILEGLARYIQYDSQAQVAYETAIEYSAGGSFGYYRFLTDYAYDEGEEQELKVVPVYDPLTIYGVLVPACFNRKVPFAFVVEDVPKEEYKLQYPNSSLASIDWAEAEKDSEGWIGSDSVRIAEYWYAEQAKASEDDDDAEPKATSKTPTRQRAPKPKIKCAKINGMEVLEEYDWVGSTIPIIPVLGKQMIIEGKPQLYSVVRPQKAAQQLLNYTKSRIAETLSIAPISPWIMAVGQIPSGKQQQWENANTTATVLEYNVVDAAGRPAPPPQRQTFEPPIASLSAFVAQEVDDMKATTGIFDASLGNQANETSGKAILARRDQANLTTMHYIDNLARSFKQGGDIIAEVVPKIYDTEREIEILGEDEKQKVVTINKAYEESPGKVKHYKVAGAKMSYVVSMGQAFDSKRAESFDTMQQVLSSAPDLIHIIGDIFFQQSDLAGADQIAERLHKMLPPPLQDQGEQTPEQAQAMLAQAHQQMQAMGGELQKLQFERQAKVQEGQNRLQEVAAKFQADMALEKLKLENALTIAEVQTKAQSQLERQKTFANMESQFHDQAHDAGMSAQEHTQALAQGQQQAQNQAQLADQSAQNQAAQSAQDAAQAQANQPEAE